MIKGAPMELRLVYPGLDIQYTTDSGVSQVDNSESTVVISADLQEASTRLGSRLAVHSRHFALIPNELQVSGLGPDPLVQLGMSPDCPYAKSSLPEWGASLYYSLESLQVPWSGQGKPSSIWHPLLVYFAEMVGLMKGPSVLIHLTPVRCHILAGNPGKLHFFNTFIIKDPADLLYFALKTLQEWKKSPESTPVRLSGHFEADSPLYALLSQYLGDLEVAPPSSLVLEGLDAFPPHRYVDLSSFASCASSAAS